MRYLTPEEILRLHFQVINDFGGLHGVRDERRLRSLALAPRQEVFGKEQYPSVFEKAAVYMCNIIRDHPFVDGNKRTAVTVCGVFLVRNGVKQTASPEDLEDFVVKVVTDHLDAPTIAAWLEAHAD